ncbi:MAG: hypothetical protein E7014_02425 [Alphaproteobacteria bacterium]|nr:hypothetical protein [Alphaproteobacteria bacterium]
MTSDYENFVNLVKAEITFNFTDVTSITEADIKNVVQDTRDRYKKRHNITISDEDALRAVSELLHFYAVTMTDEDSELFETRIKSTWWTDSAETREKDGRNYYWNSYKEYLLKKDKLPADVIERIDERSDKVMNYLFDPTNPDIRDIITRRGMVIGSVQSGKTANYSALVAKAADAGYKIIIIIAGISSLLRKQTQFRINCGFVGLTDLNRDEPEKIPEKPCTEGTVTDYRGQDKSELERLRPFAMTNERMSGDFKTTSSRAQNQTNLNNTTSPLVFVIKKNTTVLQRLIEWLDGKDLSEKSLLLIDDEADNASVNTKKEYDEVTAINKKIRSVLKNFKKSAYVGFTATPFANIFIDPMLAENSEDRDLYPSDFIISLVSPDNYFGPQKVFGPENAEESEYIRLLTEENTGEAKEDWQKYFPVKQKKGVTCHKVDDLPRTLKEAINLFIFNIYVRNHRGYANKHNSMLIHVSCLVDMHSTIKEQVTKYLLDLENNIRNYAGMKGTSEYLKYIAPLEKIFEDMLEGDWASSPKFDTPDFDEMLPELPNIVASINVGMSNTKEASIKYSSEHQTNMIAVGGNSLARGFTIENLSVSYFLRNTKMCDTLLQMGRWFGYRRDYDDLCKVYTTEKYYDNFHNALISTNSLVNCVKSMEKAGKTPTEFLVTVSQHPATQMILTAKNKMYNANKDNGVFLDGHIREKGTYNRSEMDEVANYFSTAENFISQLGTPETVSQINNSDDPENCYRWLNVPAEKIIGLIEKCPKSFNNINDSDLLIKYIKENKKHNWRVVLPYAQNGNEVKLSGSNISFCKFTRFDKLENDKRSFAVSDKKQEQFGSLKEEYPKEITRENLRLERNDPLLIVNIFDLYEHMSKEDRKYKEKILVKENFPFFSLSFPGSFEKPKFNPLMGFKYNKILQEQLRAEIREQEESSDDVENEYE